MPITNFPSFAKATLLGEDYGNGRVLSVALKPGIRPTLTERWMIGGLKFSLLNSYFVESVYNSSVAKALLVNRIVKIEEAFTAANAAYNGRGLGPEKEEALTKLKEVVAERELAKAELADWQASLIYDNLRESRPVTYVARLIRSGELVWLSVLDPLHTANTHRLALTQTLAGAQAQQFFEDRIEQLIQFPSPVTFGPNDTLVFELEVTGPEVETGAEGLWAALFLGSFLGAVSRIALENVSITYSPEVLTGVGNAS